MATSLRRTAIAVAAGGLVVLAGLSFLAAEPKPLSGASSTPMLMPTLPSNKPTTLDTLHQSNTKALPKGPDLKKDLDAHTTKNGLNSNAPKLETKKGVDDRKLHDTKAALAKSTGELDKSKRGEGLTNLGLGHDKSGPPPCTGSHLECMRAAETKEKDHSLFVCESSGGNKAADCTAAVNDCKAGDNHCIQAELKMLKGEETTFTAECTKSSSAAACQKIVQDCLAGRGAAACLQTAETKQRNVDACVGQGYNRADCAAAAQNCKTGESSCINKEAAELASETTQFTAACTQGGGGSDCKKTVEECLRSNNAEACMSAAVTRQQTVNTCVSRGYDRADCAAAAQNCHQDSHYGSCVDGEAAHIAADTGQLTTACAQGGGSEADCKKAVQTCLATSNAEACMSAAVTRQQTINSCVTNGGDRANCTAAAQQCHQDSGYARCVGGEAAALASDTTQFTAACAQSGSADCQKTVQACLAASNPETCMSTAATREQGVATCIGSGGNRADCAAAAQNCRPGDNVCVKKEAAEIASDSSKFTAACVTSGGSKDDCAKTVQACLATNNAQACMSTASAREQTVVTCVSGGGDAANCTAAAQNCRPGDNSCVKREAAEIANDTKQFTTACAKGGGSKDDCAKAVQACLTTNNAEACMSAAAARQQSVNTCVSGGLDKADCTAAAQSCKPGDSACVDQQAKVMAQDQKQQDGLASKCEAAGGDKSQCTQAAQTCMANGAATDACVTNVENSLAASN
jgi:hypothetical protein